MIIGAVSISESESNIDYVTEIKREWYESGVGGPSSVSVMPSVGPHCV